MRAWSNGLDPSERAAEGKGVLQRAIVLRTAAGEIPTDIALDPFARHAELSATTQPLPPYVRCTVARGLSRLDGVEYRSGTPLVTKHGFRLDSETLDPETGAALLDAVTAALSPVAAFEMDVRSERRTTRFSAPMTADGWRAVGAATTELGAWLAKRWPSSYRT